MTHTPNRRARIAREIRQAMEWQEKTPDQLAAVAGISQAQIHRRLKGKRPFFMDELDAIAKFLGIRASELSRATDVSA